MPAVGPMYTDRFDANGGLIPDPAIQSAQLRNRYDAWSRLSTPAQAVLNKLGPTDAFDSMAKNFTTAEDAQRARGRDPFRDAPSAAAAMQSVDASPSITAMRALAPQGNERAGQGVAAYHKRFDSANATRVATAKAAQDRADAELKNKQAMALKQAEFDNALAKQKLQNEGGLAQRKIQAQGDARYGKLQAENAELRRRGAESSAHTKRIQGMDRTIKSLYDKYGSAQAKAISHSRWITDPQAYNESLGFKDAPTDPTAFANWLLSQPGADVRLGVDPAAINAYRQERGYEPTPEQPGGIQQMFGGLVDGVRGLLNGPGPAQTQQQPQAAPPQQAMIADPYSDAEGAWSQADLADNPTHRGMPAPVQGWDGMSRPEMMPAPMPEADMQQIRSAISGLSPEQFQAKLAQLQAVNAPPGVIYAARQEYDRAQQGQGATLSGR